jgi:uncharacterized lipoprotein
LVAAVDGFPEGEGDVKPVAMFLALALVAGCSANPQVDESLRPNPSDLRAKRVAAWTMV